MEGEVHGENSSSPNVNNTIRSIKKRAVGPFDRIELSDGSCFMIHRMFPPSFSCAIGSNLSAHEVELLSVLFEEGKAWEKALELLKRRNHSRQELKLKLLKKQFSGSVTDVVLDRLYENGLINDRGFSEEWVLSRLSRHPQGYQALLGGLLRKGVTGTQANEVLNKVYTDEVALDAAGRVWEKGIRKGRSPEELKTLLSKRGFRSYIIHRFLSEE